MHARTSWFVAVPLIVLALTGCAAEPTEERTEDTGTAVTAPECVPAAKDSPGECAANAESDALLEEHIAQCSFGVDAVTRDFTEEFGWIWWNPAQPGTTSAMGLDLATGDVVCT